MLILDAALVPFTQAVLPAEYRFQQNNNHKHCAHYTNDYFAEMGINWWPELNRIENVWGSTKEHLRNESMT